MKNHENPMKNQRFPEVITPPCSIGLSGEARGGHKLRGYGHPVHTHHGGGGDSRTKKLCSLDEISLGFIFFYIYMEKKGCS